ncbi:MAG: hypothetical protein KC594_18700 [Nitrospira sp.]|nr:hypothetical protein [Nitrospira sp.]
MLGKRPWSEERISKAYWHDHKALEEELATHPGRVYHLEMVRIKKGGEIFEKATEELTEVISAYKRELDKESIPTRRTQSRFDLLDTTLCMRMIMASVAAMSLVDYSRRSRRNLPEIPNFDDMRKQLFSGEPPHEFIQDLRNYAAHYDLPTSEWEFSVIWHNDARGKEERIDLFIDSKKLLEFNDWKPASRAFLSRNERIGLEEVFSQYKQKVVNFNQWLLSVIEKEVGENIQDYRRSVVIVERERWRCRLTLAISRTDPKATDFLGAFHEHLTLQEKVELECYPTRSDKQLERLREVLNVYGAFDDELYEELRKKSQI